MTLRSGLHIHPLNGIGTSAQEGRQALAGLVTEAGVLDGLRVTGTAGWQYSVTAGHVAATRDHQGDGIVLFANDSPVLVDCTPSPGTGARIDIIYAKHNDSADHGDPDNLPILAVAEGIASGTPTAPDLPIGAEEVGRATVGSGATNTAHANVTLDHSQVRRAEMYRAPAIAGRRYGSTVANSIPNNVATMVSPGNDAHYQGVSGAPSGIRIDTPGWYTVAAGARFESNTSGAREVQITRNTSTIIANSRQIGYSNDALNVSITMYLDAGDALNLWVVQNSGGSLNLNPGQGQPYLSVAFVGA